MISEDVKHIYNSYLRSLARQQNRGFRNRKNFDNFDDESVIACTQIKKILSTYPHINIDTFFEAPGMINPDRFYTLQYYTTYQAMKSYTAWLKQRQNLPPDNEYHLSSIQRSLKTITRYCIENSVPWDDFLISDNLVPHWVQQLKDQTIDIYALMGYANLRQEIDRLSDDIKALYIHNIGDNYIKLKQAFMKSKYAKPLVEQGHKKCKKFVSGCGI